ncbi:uncharacterized protein LOC129000691 [Macrosteles quadrilineatus]|uniref:uncharacterized protein LOC129000691 n=1 Tax=Macrosteles quadrilineatus TaxID=74068 RepID=UPI0023E090B7|nr:uncharacterized protein LOC129000691 [Macrosteles quadrilineatus]
MMAPVLSSIVALFFPIVCNAALTALITDPQSVNIGALGGVKSTRSFSTSTHRLECSTFHQTFYLNIDRQQKPFQSIAVVSKLVNRQLLPLEAFAGDSCDDTGMTDSVYAGYDRVEFKLNTGYVVIIVNHAWQHKQDGAFDPSPWTFLLNKAMDGHCRKPNV